MLRISIVLTSALTVFGCGANTAHVSGKVTINSQPLERGLIMFVPADGGESEQQVQADIRGGGYELKIKAGKYKVLISAPILVMQDGYELTRERLPSQFNTSTTLEYEAKPGSQTRDWPMMTK